jgi:hypothetical protein
MANRTLQSLFRDPKNRLAARGTLAQVLSRLPSQKALKVEVERKSGKSAEKAA